MITQPTTARILEVLQTELSDHILPLVDDPQALASLHMVHHTLGTLGVRAENEIAWMIEETDDLERLATEIVEALPQSNRVAAALESLRSTPASSLHLSDVARRYSTASEILSCALEETSEGSELRRSAEEHLDTRLAHEVAIMGEFQLVGRS
jgi:hypothetical protein